MSATDLALPARPAIYPSSPPLKRVLRPGWPLALLFYGFPVWWALGLAGFIFFIAAGPMALELLRRRSVRTPRWFGLWLVFLVWVLLGTLTLWTHAPGTQSGGGPARLINYGMHCLWFVSCTVVMLYVYNLSERELPSRRIKRMLAFMFVVTATFGLLGTMAPTFEFTSLMELVMPGGLSHATFIHSMIHPALASASDVLGFDQARPIAPFMYANAWGNNLALYAPMFVAAWMGKGAGWRVLVAPVVLLGAAIPVVHSLDRGLWIGMSLAVLFTALRLAVAGRTRVLTGVAVALVIGSVGFVASPLYDTVTARAAHPHSNERRGNLAAETMTTALSSPVIGYGGTRQKQGGFASIASGNSAHCESCAPPSLGTQGFLWYLVLASGYVGAGLCLLYLLSQFLSSVRRVDSDAMVASTAVLMSLVFFLVYDSLGSPLFTLMIALGLYARESSPPGYRQRSLGSHLAVARRHALLLTGLALGGAVIGTLVALEGGMTYSAESSVLMNRIPTYADVSNAEKPVPAVTIDTDAQLALAPAVFRRVSRATGLRAGRVKAHVTISAEPLTSVLNVGFQARDPVTAREGARALSVAVLDARRRLLPVLEPGTLRQIHAELSGLRLRLSRLQPGSPADEYRRSLVRNIAALRALAGTLRDAAVTPGEVIVSAHQVRSGLVRPMTTYAGSGAGLGLLVGLGLVGLAAAGLRLSLIKRRVNPLFGGGHPSLR